MTKVVAISNTEVARMLRGLRDDVAELARERLREFLTAMVFRVMLDPGNRTMQTGTGWSLRRALDGVPRG